MKTDLFQSCSHCWVFQICWHIECSTFFFLFYLFFFNFKIFNSYMRSQTEPPSHLPPHNTFTASSFMIWNSSTGIPSPPLALFIVRLPKAHLTSHSRMSGSRWVITPSWLSGWWRSFLYSSSVFPGGSEVKASAWNAGDSGSIPGLGRSPGEGNGNPLHSPGESHGGRSLVGYNPWGHKESDTTESLHFSIFVKIICEKALITKILWMAIRIKWEI